MEGRQLAGREFLVQPLLCRALYRPRLRGRRRFAKLPGKPELGFQFGHFRNLRRRSDRAVSALAGRDPGVQADQEIAG